MEKSRFFSIARSTLAVRQPVVRELKSLKMTPAWNYGTMNRKVVGTTDTFCKKELGDALVHTYGFENPTVIRFFRMSEIKIIPDCFLRFLFGNKVQKKGAFQ